MVRQATESDPTVLVLRRRYPAPRERVFEAWTDAAQLKAWFGPEQIVDVPVAEVDARKGGRYRIAMVTPDRPEPHVVFGEYLEFSPPERLVFTWTWEPPNDYAGEETEVSIELTEVDGETELVLTQTRFPNADMRDHHGIGWGGCLDRCAAYLKRVAAAS